MKYLIICIFSLFSIALHAETYQVFRKTGNPLVFKDNNWISAEKRMTISLADSIHIQEGTTLSLLNTSNNQIIEIKQVGKHKAKKIIDSTVKELSNVLAYTTKNIAQSVSKTGSKQSYNIYGATMRADQNTIESNQILAAQIVTMIEKINSGKYPKPSKYLSLEKVQLSEDIIGFKVQNNSDKAYVVNILRIPKNGNPSFCINLDKTDSEYFFTLVAPNSNTSFNEIQLKNDDATYMLIATEEIFDSTWVEQAILYNQTNNNSKTGKKIKIETFIANN